MLEIDDDLFEITYKNKVLNLCYREYELLKLLINNSNKILSKDEIIHNFWDDKKIKSRIVDTYICRIRGKLKKYGHPGILAVKKRGFRLLEV
jgi:DNA-binding response OmpR family regulator